MSSAASLGWACKSKANPDWDGNVLSLQIGSPRDGQGAGPVLQNLSCNMYVLVTVNKVNGLNIFILFGPLLVHEKCYQFVSL